MSLNDEKIENENECIDCNNYAECSQSNCSECNKKSDSNISLTSDSESDIDPYESDKSEDFTDHQRDMLRLKHKYELYKDEIKIKFGRMANKIISILNEHNLIEECEPAAYDLLNMISVFELVERQTN